MNKVNFTRNLWMGWGQGCRDERVNGRGGMDLALAATTL